MLTRFEAYQLSLEVYRSCEKITAVHYLKDQLSRASLSICLNLAEGSGKPSWKEKRRFYSIALGSMRETQSLLDILNRVEERKLSDRIGGMIYRLVHPLAETVTGART